MKIKLRGVKHVPITGDHIRLDSLLKLASVVSTGGEAKIIIQSGDVIAGGGPCVQRGRKMRPGDVVRYGGDILIVDRMSGPECL